MDLAGGVCSYTAYDVIRSVVLAVDKTNGTPDAESDETTLPAQRTGLCLMPSTLELKRAAKFVEKVGQTLVPLIHQPEAAFGEAIQFKYDETIKFRTVPSLIPLMVPSCPKGSPIPALASRLSIPKQSILGLDR